MTSPTALATRRWGASAAALALAFTLGGFLSPIVGVAQTADTPMSMAAAGGLHGQMMDHAARLLDAVGATPEQKGRIHAIMRGALAPMSDMRPRMDAVHRQLAAILGAPTVDRGALEQMRAEHMAMLDAASRRVTAAVADAADVLTPEQRAKLAQLIDARHRAS